MSEWAAAGLKGATAVKRGVYTIHASLVIKVIGQLAKIDADQLEQSLRDWLGLEIDLADTAQHFVGAEATEIIGKSSRLSAAAHLRH